MNEELLEDVPARIRVRERVRRCVGRDVMAFSESEEWEDSDLGGEGCSAETDIRSYTFLVRRIGPLLSILLGIDPSFVCLGRVSAQFSQGMALFLSFSSYVFRKLESRRQLFVPCAICKATTRGLSGGVSIAELDVGDLDAWLGKAACAPFSPSEDDELVLPALRAIPTNPSAGLTDRQLALVLGLLVPKLSSSKHDVQLTGNPSVTISGVGP